MNIRTFILAVLVSVLSLNASVYDLPIKIVNGKEYYYYQVQPKETIYSLSRQFEMSQEDMMKYNPSLIDGLKAGSTLYFPVDEFGVLDAAIKHKVSKGESVYGISKQYGMTIEDLLRLNPSAKDGIKIGEELIISAPQKKKETKSHKEGVDEEDLSVENDQSLNTIIQPKEEETAYNIALFMPFMLNEKKMSVATRTYLDFYKGFVLAIDSLNKSGRMINVYAYDSKNNVDSLNVVLSQSQIKDMNVIIAPPGNAAAVGAIANACKNTDAKVFNVFYANDTTHITNNHVIQANIVRDEMYEKVITWIADEYADYVPVVIGSPANKNRVSMVEEIKQKFKDKGVETKEIIFKRSLTMLDLDALDKTQKYLFIPLSSSEKELAKYADALKEFVATANKDVVLFGYPEWVTLKSSMRANLHALNTVIYSRFFFDENGRREKKFAQKFNETYKSPMKMSPPIQAVLGFDCGYYLINALRNGDGDVLAAEMDYDGLQYSFDLSKVRGKKGAENKALYRIYFRPDKSVKKELF